jgi:hypothetical protein
MATLTTTISPPTIQTTPHQTLPPNSQPITLEFIKPLPLYDHEKPYYMVLNSPANPTTADNDGEGTEGLQDPHSQTNIQLHLVHEIPVTNVRGREEEFTLEKNGFKFVKHESEALREKEGRWEAGGGEQGWMEYVKETAGLVKRVVGAERVICYDYRVSVLLTRGP